MQKKSQLSQKKICRSDNRCGVVDRLRKTLLNVELQCERARAEIAIRNEIMNLHSCSSKKADLQAFTVAKIEKENYELFFKRMNEMKNTLLANVELIVRKYEGAYSDVFMKHYFQDKSDIEIVAETGLSEKEVKHIIYLLRQDLITYYRSQKKEGS